MEIESVLKEWKTYQRGKSVVPRSKSPDGVLQEIWAHLLVHYAVRDLMRHAAAEAELDPDRMSFLNALRIVRRQVTEPAAFPPEALAERARGVIGELVDRANPTRGLRVCPRVVKRKMSKFLVKRKTHRDLPPRLYLPAAEAIIITEASKTQPCQQHARRP